MKLQYQKTWERKGTEYGKYVVVLPSKDMDRLGWNDGVELEGEIRDGEYCIKPKN